MRIERELQIATLPTPSVCLPSRSLYTNSFPLSYSFFCLCIRQIFAHSRGGRSLILRRQQKSVGLLKHIPCAGSPLDAPVSKELVFHHELPQLVCHEVEQLLSRTYTGSEFYQQKLNSKVKKVQQTMDLNSDPAFYTDLYTDYFFKICVSLIRVFLELRCVFLKTRSIFKNTVEKSQEFINNDRINTPLLCNRYVKLNYFRVRQFLSDFPEKDNQHNHIYLKSSKVTHTNDELSLIYRTQYLNISWSQMKGLCECEPFIEKIFLIS